MLQGIWEATAPHADLAPHRAAYRFVSQVYPSIQPSRGSDDLLWARLGTKTVGLVHEHMSDVAVTRAHEVIATDADTAAKLLEERIDDEVENANGTTAEEIVDSIAERLKKRTTKPGNGTDDHPVFRSLAERLDRLRQRTIATSEQSIEWLPATFDPARDVTAVETLAIRSPEGCRAPAPSCRSPLKAAC